METSPLVVALFTGSHDKDRGSLVQNIMCKMSGVYMR